MWALCNISGDSIEMRDEILRTGFVEYLADILQQSHVRTSCLRLTCWGIANLCRGKPIPDMERVLLY